MTYGKGSIARAVAIVASVAGLIVLAGCGGGGGTPAGVPITVTVSASANSLNPGQSATITATVANSSNTAVTWSISPAGFGSLSSTTANPVTYTAPASVPTATTVTITATSAASSSAAGNVQIAVATSAIGVSLSPAAPQTLNQGQQLSINATLANDSSGKGVTWSLSPNVGSFVSQTASSATYQAPNPVSSNTTVTITATSVADSNAKASVEVTDMPSGAGANVAAVTVNGNLGAANIAYTSVLICAPGSTTNCLTVDNIQVDTGSEGLRILDSAIPGLALPTLTDTSGNTIFNCVGFADTSFLWGPVQQADVKMAGESASQSLIQVVSSSSSGIPTACSNGGTLENTPQSLGANGILGVGLEPTDCTLAGSNFCDGSISNPANVYFSCPSSGCTGGETGVAVPASDQVVNPVVLFADNNGTVLTFPSLSGSASSLSGNLIFGINTGSNNTLPGAANVFGLDVNDNFVTLYDGQNLNASFIDSGSNALFFPADPAVLPSCSGSISDFFCPGGLTAQSATQQGSGGIPSVPVNFSIDNANTLFSNANDFVFDTLGGSAGGTFNSCTSNSGDCSFDWGLPFFFGRNVFTAIDGETVSGVGNGPFWAY